VPRRFALVNATIWTLDDNDPRAESLLVEDGRITAVGTEKKVLRKARDAKKTDLHGASVLPGLIDAHTHLIHQGLLQGRIDLRNTKSLHDALQTVRRHVARLPKGHLVLAERWDESRWKERRYPTRQELDDISQDHPIILRRVDGHIAVANKHACDLVAPKLDGVDPQTGQLIEQASLNLNQIFPTPPQESAAALEYAQKQALRLGVTTVHDFVVPTYLRAYQELHRRGRLRIRAHVTPYIEYLDQLSGLGLQTGWGDDRLRLGGVKLFGDGSLGGHTAALRSPYRDEPQNQGKLNWTDAQLQEKIGLAHRSGLQVSAHAIGDAAIDQVVAAYRRLGPSARGARHRIEHFELHHAEHHEALRDLGVVASMQPNFVGEWSKGGGMYDARLGQRHRRNNEFERLRKTGVRLAFGSDCMPFDPWFGLRACTHAPYRPQRLTAIHALQAYTRGGAWSLHREHDLGALRTGAWADFVIVNWKDPQTTDLSKTKVRATFVGGRQEHPDGTSVLRFH
jgi:predicted amidohydrolase YtcJ